MISIKGMDKARVLLALYNGSEVRGMGALSAHKGPLTLEECQGIVAECATNGNTEMHFDYVYGRVLKVRIGGEELDPRLYDRDLGQGAAEAAILEEFTRSS